MATVTTKNFDRFDTKSIKILHLNEKYRLNEVVTFPFKGISYKFRYTEQLQNAIMKISPSCVVNECTNEGSICKKGANGASKGNYICADTGVHLSDKMKYEKQWIKTQRSGRSKYYDKTKQELNIIAMGKNTNRTNVLYFITLTPKIESPSLLRVILRLLLVLLIIVSFLPNCLSSTMNCSNGYIVSELLLLLYRY